MSTLVTSAEGRTFSLVGAQRLVFSTLAIGRKAAFEIEKLTGMSGDTIRPRLIELRAKGLVRDSGRRVRTPFGRLAIVWETSGW